MIQFFQRLRKEEKGGLDEVLSFFLGFVFIFFFVLPPVTEFLSTYLQTQEVEHLTAMAAKRACTLLPSNLDEQGAESRQGALSPMLRVDETVLRMYEAVYNTFKENAKNFDYYKNNPLNLRIYDIFDNDLTSGQNGNFPDGYMGASPSRHICPALPASAGGGTINDRADWCLSQGSFDPVKLAQIKKAFKQGDKKDMTQSEQQSEGIPASIRQEILQSGRSIEGMNAEQWKKSLRGVLYKCVVTAQKDRQTIFNFAGIGGEKTLINKILPEKLTKQADATFRYENASPLEHRAYNIGSQILPNFKSYEMADVTDANAVGACTAVPGQPLPANCVGGRDLGKISEKNSNGDYRLDSHKGINVDFFDGDPGAKSGYALLDEPARDIQ